MGLHQDPLLLRELVEVYPQRGIEKTSFRARRRLD